MLISELHSIDFGIVRSLASTQGSYGPANLHDGDLTTRFSSKRLEKQWVKVYLARKVFISLIIIENVRQKPPDRIVGATVTVLWGNKNVKMVTKLKKIQLTYRVECGGKYGDGIRIYLEKLTYLILSEIRILGYPGE